MPTFGKSMAAWVASALVVLVGGALPAAAGAARVPAGDRAYEMVSPLDKAGTGIVVESQRTRAAEDGDAIGFISLGAFGDVVGTGVATDYLAQRIASGAPGPSDPPNGWRVHAMTPRLQPNSLTALLGGLESLYMGEFSPDLSRGVFAAASPVTGDASVANATNFYRRTDLRTSGTGFYELLTSCPLCDATSAPLPAPTTRGQLINRRPWLAGASPDLERFAFESQIQLTDDAPVQSSGSPRLYEWNAGEVRYAGRIPVAPAIECDDVNGPLCTAAGASVGGQGAGSSHGATLTPHVVSDGADGHSRIILTVPTSNGTAIDDDEFAGDLYMRTDSARTVQLNASERAAPDRFWPAQYLDASADGTRIFFRSIQALTDDATTLGVSNLYMYDATKPASAPDNLTLLTVDEEPGDVIGEARRLVGASADGRYAYMVVEGQLVAGAPLLGPEPGLYLWHDGDIRYIGRAPNGTTQTEIGTDVAYQGRGRQARVTPDGRHLLFGTNNGTGLLGKDHGRCVSELGGGCRQLYVYSADTGALACVSCPPSGPATAMATVAVRSFNGGTQTSSHETTAITDDGSRVFFSTADALVPQDVNGRIDAYEYDLATATARLLSSGTDPGDSWFLDASTDGGDVFFATREQLVGWDSDATYDLYDARVGGGFPEPAEVVACRGDSCQGPAGLSPSLLPPASSAFDGPGDEPGKLRPRPKKCRRGFVKKRVRGRSRCVRRRSARGRRVSRRARRATTVNRRGS